MVEGEAMIKTELDDGGSVEVFVPGRLCIIGEHSDWAGAFRVTNPKIGTGYAVVAGTQQGIRARCIRLVQPILRVKISGHDDEEFPLSQGNERLLEAAKHHQFWRYVCGTAYMASLRFSKPSDFPGIEISVVETSLPMQRGLSSSAAICVLTARAFNHLWKLSLSIDGIMDLAYAGERVALSLCGRLDQAVAFGPGHTGALIFDGDVTTSIPIQLPRNQIFLVFADLNAHKNTVRILSSLQEAFPYPRDARDQKLHKLLAESNRDIFFAVKRAIEEGDAQRLGELMVEYQKQFDEAAIPLCPDELTAPRLHEVLASEKVRHLTFGGKGVGSQGDGAVQFVARDEQCASELAKVLVQDLGCAEAFVLPIGSPRTVDGLMLPATAGEETPHPLEVLADDGDTRTVSDDTTWISPRMNQPKLIRKAVITAAGLGTRLFPATKAIRPKPMMPILDPDDSRLKPVILYLVQECLQQAGLEQVVIVVGPGEEEKSVREFFEPCHPALLEKLKPEARDFAEELASLGKRITLVVQEKPEGFGHAVAQAAKVLEHEPFVLLLGDVVFLPSAGVDSCVSQVITAFEQSGGVSSMLGTVSVRDPRPYGTLTGKVFPSAPGIVHVTDMVEKPNWSIATERLQPPPGITRDGEYLIVLGPYILTPLIVNILNRHIDQDQRSKGEIQLTSALEEARSSEGLLACLLAGEALDIGLPMEFGKTLTTLYTRAKNMSSVQR
mmetsp:Transcript_15252/g.31009  ORF Transcript_15252/g.31009 Transcript_15252/m.31009 type:complete len:725 (-) Transcript_15252:130-2304(-)